VTGKRRLLVLAAAVCFGFGLAGPATTTADVPPDILDSYDISIAPLPDGMLQIDYRLTGYHAASDWPSDQPYLQIGVPNGYFTIDSSSSNGVAVSSVSAETGYPSLVQLNFSSLPRTGDTFDLHFTINQGHMAYSNGSETSFEFIPSGWTFPITVKRMTVTWTNPSGTSPVWTQPQPTMDGNTMSWTWDGPKSDGSGMYSGNAINIAYSASAFSVTGDTQAQDETSSNPSGSGGGVDSVFQVLIFIVFAGGIIWSWISKTDGYGGGPGIHAGRIGGFRGGGFGGGGGCACACAGCACACACACAGGGKVGCSRKAIGIACLPKVLRKTSAP